MSAMNGYKWHKNIIQMDIPEQRYRKIVATYRPLLYNLICQYPIPEQVQLPANRNLKYLIQKQQYSSTLPLSTYLEIPQQIKQSLSDPTIQNKLLTVRLIRCLPFHYRVKVIQQAENELSMFAMRQGLALSPQRKALGSSTAGTPEFHYEAVADLIDLLMSVYQLSGLSEEIYFDVNQKITSIISHIIQKCFSNDRNVCRNSFQALRSIFLVFSECKGRASNKKKPHLHHDPLSPNQPLQPLQPHQPHQPIFPTPQNRLISKICTLFNRDQSFQLQSSSSSTTFQNSSNNQSQSTNPRIRSLITKTKEYEIRVRCRMLTGISYLLTYIEQSLPELYQLLVQQIFIILDNVNQFDINLECFLNIKALLALPLEHCIRTKLIKKWVEVLSQLSNSYKKEYYPFYIQILKEVCEFEYCPLRIKYFTSTNFLQITRSIQQQLSRFIVYKFSCRNIILITNSSLRQPQHSQPVSIPTKSNIKPLQDNNIILNIFHYTWFIDRVQEEGDLFRCQFLIALLHAYFMYPNRMMLENKGEIRDLLDLCHRLINWTCSWKDQMHIPTIKFTFDMYLEFFKEAAQRLGADIEKYINQLIQRCNGSNVYLLFKFKLIATFIKLQCYSKNILTYSQTKLNLDFLEGQVAPFMMPKNPKPIFDYDYSLTADGQIESRKQIETIKVIMELLSAVEQVYKQYPQTVQTVNSMVIRYHEYLNNLEQNKSCNKDLINCLQSLEADHYFTNCQRNFLLSLIDEQDSKGNNIQYTLNDRIVFSPFQSFDSDQEYNIFGEMSPVHLKIRLLGGRGYTSVYVQAKKSQWVGIPEMKLVVSSAIQIKQVPFQSCIIQIKIDRSGLINFEAWTTEGTPLMLGSGSHRINRKFLWLQVDHLRIIDGIRSKAFLSRPQLSGGKQIKPIKDETFLTYCFGEPILLQIIYSRNQIVVTVNNKQVWLEVQELIGKMVEQIFDGTAEVIRSQ